MQKTAWRKHLPKSIRTQNEIWKKSMLYSSAAWKQYVHSKEDAVNFIGEIYDLIEKKGLDIKTTLAVILELSDKKLGTNQGVKYLQEVILEILDSTENM